MAAETLAYDIKMSVPGSLVPINSLTLAEAVAVAERSSKKILKIGVQAQRDAFRPDPQLEKEFKVSVFSGKEAEDTLRSSVLESYGSTLLHLGEDEKQANLDAVMGALTQGKLVKIEKSGQLLGMILMRDMELDGKIDTLVSWIWSNRGAGGNKDLFRAAVNSILRKSPNLRIVAAIHLINKRSQAFFTSIGFSPLCVFIPK